MCKVSRVCGLTINETQHKACCIFSGSLFTAMICVNIIAFKQGILLFTMGLGPAFLLFGQHVKFFRFFKFSRACVRREREQHIKMAKRKKQHVKNTTKEVDWRRVFPAFHEHFSVSRRGHLCHLVCFHLS